MKNGKNILGIIAVMAIIVFNTCGGGKGSNADSANPDSTPVAYAIGDKGPGGGIVFYDKGSVSDGWRYLEAAPDNQGTSLAWVSDGFFSTDITGTGTDIGAGKENTRLILAKDEFTPAAKATQGVISEKSDWFLPSRDELDEMYKARTHLGISSGFFWSSSQYDNSRAWYQDFGDGSQDYSYEYNKVNLTNVSVRAIRAF